MPRVGNKTYAYNAEGRRKAKAASKRTGKPVAKGPSHAAYVAAKKGSVKRRTTRGR